MRTQSRNPRTAWLAGALRPAIVAVALVALLLGRWVAPAACQPVNDLARESASAEPAGIIGSAAYNPLR